MCVLLQRHFIVFMSVNEAWRWCLADLSQCWHSNTTLSKYNIDFISRGNILNNKVNLPYDPQTITIVSSMEASPRTIRSSSALKRLLTAVRETLVRYLLHDKLLKSSNECEVTRRQECWCYRRKTQNDIVRLQSFCDSLFSTSRHLKSYPCTFSPHELSIRFVLDHYSIKTSFRITVLGHVLTNSIDNSTFASFVCVSMCIQF